MALLLPDWIADSVCDLTPQLLNRLGITVLLLDFDNTVLPYTSDEPTPEVAAWLTAVRDGGIRLCVVSNSRKPRAPQFCDEWGIDCLTGAKKPFSRGIRAAKARYASCGGAIALVGDQIYTDVLGANRAGLFSILVRPIHLSNIWLRLRHVLELPWIAMGRRKVRREQNRMLSSGTAAE